MRFVPAIILTILAGMNSVMNTDCILLLTFVGIFLVPGLYILFETWSSRLKTDKKYDEDED